MSSDGEPVRVTKQGHKFIKEARAELDTIGTIQRFVEIAVSENVRYLQNNLRGTDDLRELCKYLSDINGVDLSLPNQTPRARLASENLNRRVLVDLPAEDQEAITVVRDCTELDRSKVIRLCILRHLYELSNETSLFVYPKNETVEDAWLPAKKAIDSTFPRMVYELHLQVVEQQEFLKNRIERDQHSGKRFKGYYENHFCPTAGYDRLIENELGSETLETLESILASAVG